MSETGKDKAGRDLVSLFLVLGILGGWLSLGLMGSTVYFATDDLMFMERAMFGSIKAALDPFIIGRVFFRPLTQDLYFRLMHSLFGLHPAPWHAFNMLVHGLNLYLIVRLGARITGERRAGLWAGFFYALSPVNFRIYVWISCIQDTAMIFFSLLAVLFFLKGKESGKGRLFAAGGPFTFLLALLCKESCLWLPVWLWVLDLAGRDAAGRKGVRSRFFSHLPFDLIMAGYLAFRLGWMPAPREGLYRVSFFGPHLLTNLEFYLQFALMSLGLPTIDAARSYYLHTILAASLAVVLAVWAVRTRRQSRMAVIGLSWFLLGVCIFLPLVDQTYEYYISLACIGLFWAAGSVAARIGDRIGGGRGRAAALAYALYLVAYCGFVNYSFHGDHWIVKLGEMTEGLHRELKKAHPDFPVGARLIFVNKPGDDPSLLGIRALYNRRDLKIYLVDQAFKIGDTPEGKGFIPRSDFDYRGVYMFYYNDKAGLVEYKVSRDGLSITPMSVSGTH